MKRCRLFETPVCRRLRVSRVFCVCRVSCAHVPHQARCPKPLYPRKLDLGCNSRCTPGERAQVWLRQRNRVLASIHRPGCTLGARLHMPGPEALQTSASDWRLLVPRAVVLGSNTYSSRNPPGPARQHHSVPPSGLNLKQRRWRMRYGTRRQCRRDGKPRKAAIERVWVNEQAGFCCRR